MPVTGSKASDQALCGFTAGAVSTLILHPMDLLKTRLQVNELSLKSSIKHVLPEIIKSDGLSGIYRGIGPNFIGATASWGIYFYIYTKLKSLYNINDNLLRPDQHLIASAGAGSITAVLTNPIWVVKVRMFTQSSNDIYKGLFGNSYPM
jgi:solute carrier family 25 folate transporter 32